MADDFDPYHQWLGIPKAEQPANYYRLLGLSVGESDPEVVQCAADQRMQHLRTFQIGKHGALSQKLLNEVAAAKLVLLNPAKRAAYDLRFAPPETTTALSSGDEDSSREEEALDLGPPAETALPASASAPLRLSVGTPHAAPAPGATTPLSVAPTLVSAPTHALPHFPEEAPAARSLGKFFPVALVLGVAALVVLVGWAFSPPRRTETAQLDSAGAEGPPPAATGAAPNPPGLPGSPAVPSGGSPVPPHGQPFPQGGPPFPYGGPRPGPYSTPDGRTPPPGWVPPPGWTPPPGWIPPPGWTGPIPQAMPGRPNQPVYVPAAPNPPPNSTTNPGPSNPPGRPSELGRPSESVRERIRRPVMTRSGSGVGGLGGLVAPSMIRAPQTATGGPTSPALPSEPPPTTFVGDGFPNFPEGTNTELLPWIDPERDALAWQPYRTVDGGLQSDANGFCRCFLPFPTPTEFRVVMEVTRDAPGQPLFLAYTWGGEYGGVLLSLKENGGQILGHGSAAGFSSVWSWAQPTLTPGRKRRIAFTVRLRRLTVEVDDAIVLDGAVDLAQWSLVREKQTVPVNYPWRLMLASQASSDRIHRIAWAPLDAEVRMPTPPAAPPAFVARARELYGDPAAGSATGGSARENGRRAATEVLRAARAVVDPSEQAHLFDLARAWAEQAPDVDLAFEAVDRRFERFAGDPLAAKVESFGVMARQADADQAADLAVRGATLFRLVVRAERAGHADRLADHLGIVLGKTPGNAAAANAAKQTLKAIREQAERLVKEMKPIRDAFTKLSADPAHPQAHGVVGRHYCLVREDWSRGAEHLRRSDDERLSQLAQRELHAPQDGPGRSELAEAWRKAAESASNLHRPAMLRRSAMWRQAAARRLDGLPQAAERKRMEDLGPFNLDPWDASQTIVFRDRVFHLRPAGPGWNAAQEWARQRGGALACIRSAPENDALSAFAAAAGVKTFFIGATDEGTEGRWRWIDGAPFLFTRWERGSPDDFGRREHYGVVRSDLRQWADVPDDHPVASIVQWTLPKEWPRDP